MLSPVHVEAGAALPMPAAGRRPLGAALRIFSTALALFVLGGVQAAAGFGLLVWSGLSLWGVDEALAMKIAVPAMLPGVAFGLWLAYNGLVLERRAASGLGPVD